MLRGKASLGRAVDCEQNGWNIYVGYSPGVAHNHGTPPIPFSFGFNQRVLSTPPFLYVEESDDSAPSLQIIAEQVEGCVLEIMIGEEQWQSSSFSGEKKAKSEFRRFVIV
eukprot:2855080-Pleurochrysis_carterae.AAC.1